MTIFAISDGTKVRNNSVTGIQKSFRISIKIVLFAVQYAISGLKCRTLYPERHALCSVSTHSD